MVLPKRIPEANIGAVMSLQFSLTFVLMTVLNWALQCTAFLPLSAPAGPGPGTGVSHRRYVRRLGPCARKHDQGEAFRVPGGAAQAAA